MSPRSWRRISEGDARNTILAVDFDSTARPEAGFQRFAALLKPDRELWRTAQPAAADTELLSAKAYLQFWRDRPEGARGHVNTVMGYCVGSVFAAALAEQIAEEQDSMPALLLFDPEPVENDSLCRDFVRAVGTMSMLSPQEQAGCIAEARAVCQAAEGDFTTAAAQVIKLYETAAGLAFDRLGLDEETSADLIGMFRSYVSYLAAAWQLSPEPRWATAVALTSAHSSPGARHAGSEQSFPVDAAQLLNDQHVAEAAQRFLAQRGA